MHIRDTIIKAFEIVRAPYTASDVERVYTKVMAQSSTNPVGLAWVAAKRVGLDLIRHREAVKRMEAAEQIRKDKQAKLAAIKLTAHQELVELIRDARIAYQGDQGILNQLNALEAFEVFHMTTEQVMSLYGLKQDAAYKRRSRAVAFLAPLASPLLREQILKIRKVKPRKK